jgi:hypothetical protein
MIKIWMLIQAYLSRAAFSLNVVTAMSDHSPTHLMSFLFVLRQDLPMCPGWPQTHDLPASASQVLGLWACTTTPDDVDVILLLGVQVSFVVHHLSLLSTTLPTVPLLGTMEAYSFYYLSSSCFNPKPKLTLFFIFPIAAHPQLPRTVPFSFTKTSLSTPACGASYTPTHMVSWF